MALFIASATGQSVGGNAFVPSVDYLKAMSAASNVPYVNHVPGLQPPIPNLMNSAVPGPNPDPNCGSSMCPGMYGQGDSMLPTHGHKKGMFDASKPVGYAKGFQQTGVYQVAPAMVPSYMMTREGMVHPAYLDGKMPKNALYPINTAGRRNLATKWMRPGPGIWKSGKFGI